MISRKNYEPFKKHMFLLGLLIFILLRVLHLSATQLHNKGAHYRYHPFQNRPADFPLVGAGPNFCPQNSFGRYRYVQKAQNQLYNFRKSGFPEFPDPDSGSGYNKKSGQFHAGSGNTIKFRVGGTQVKLGPFQLCSNYSINSEKCRSFFFHQRKGF